VIVLPHATSMADRKLSVDDIMKDSKQCPRHRRGIPGARPNAGGSTWRR
jgi:hypothetical protein